MKPEGILQGHDKIVSRVDSLRTGKFLPASLSHKDKFLKVEEIPEPSMYFDHDCTVSQYPIIL
ncbi:hypothetical protein BPAE_0157g00020 [Botrytis paeoniae]|uniref:Uncharacterized protein n=1 Tax=Botrytis paeoniae TaxID=278948 RepID=A0A4Z1FDW8_9HELO|nr:hypothetical protein BPAE_0157g00020 [Botrytis paeoniae]